MADERYFLLHVSDKRVDESGQGASEGFGAQTCLMGYEADLFLVFGSFMPYKYHDAHRHKFEKARYRVMNWPDYDRGLVQRGDVRFWIEESALEAWSAPLRKTPGGQAVFSNLAIETTLMLGAVYRLPLRQNEGFVRSLLSLIGGDLAVPDHTTLSRRRRRVEVDCCRSRRSGTVDIVLDSTGLKFYGAGEWARKKHGEKRRARRKLHVAVDPARCEIVAYELSDDDTSDPAMAAPLVMNAGGRIRRILADDAYDGSPTYEATCSVRPTKSPPKIVIPPRAASIRLPGTPHGGSERECHAAEIASHGRMAWQKRRDYGLRSLGETAIGRLKNLCNGKLSARSFGAQQKETAIYVAVASRMIRMAKPSTVRIA